MLSLDKIVAGAKVRGLAGVVPVEIVRKWNPELGEIFGCAARRKDVSCRKRRYATLARFAA
jgi:hypothetical protein